VRVPAGGALRRLRQRRRCRELRVRDAV